MKGGKEDGKGECRYYVGGEPRVDKRRYNRAGPDKNDWSKQAQYGYRYYKEVVDMGGEGGGGGGVCFFFQAEDGIRN